MITWSGLVKELVALEGAVPGLPWACEATDCKIEAASSGFAEGPAAAGVGTGVGEGPRNIASIVGRSAAPSGVDKKSLGSSLWAFDKSVSNK